MGIVLGDRRAIEDEKLPEAHTRATSASGDAVQSSSARPKGHGDHEGTHREVRSRGDRNHRRRARRGKVRRAAGLPADVGIRLALRTPRGEPRDPGRTDRNITGPLTRKPSRHENARLRVEARKELVRKLRVKAQ